ncbi:MAG: arginine--tRNA ligase [Oscillospiraceae bacterium]
MLGPIGQAIEELRGLIAAALDAAAKDGALPAPVGELPTFLVEIPADASHGDFATNVAMATAKAFRRSPKAIAEALIAHLSLDGTDFARAEIAGPGFLNVFVSRQWYANVVAQVLREGPSFGRTDFGRGERVMVEFVSANPTGPMHMGNARGGVLGDSLAAALDAAGYCVSREFYINDAGNQIEKFGLSLEARYLQHYEGEAAVAFPEDGYHGADIADRAQEYIALEGDRLRTLPSAQRRQALIDFALPRNIEKMQHDLQRYRIQFDTWFRESTLHQSGAVTAVVEQLSARGMTYEKDGAVWYRATAFGGDKDEVLVRANGFPTYFAADIAYHVNKFSVRGFQRVINIWGADHHGHVARLKGAMEAVGLPGGKLDVVLMQLVRLTRGGELVRMSKRTGNAVTLSDLLDEVPIDAARFFFNLREPGSPLDFDLDLAVEQSSQNPVYYVQYAHARICSILKNMAAEGVQLRAVTADDLSTLTASVEDALIRVLASFPDEIIMAAKHYDPARLTRYAIELATRFHRFYTDCRCKVEDESLMQARLALCLATRQVLRNVLALLGIDAPETM